MDDDISGSQVGRKREADLPIHSFSQPPVLPILFYLILQSLVRQKNKNQKPKTKKKETGNSKLPKIFSHFPLLISSSFSHDLQISLVDRHHHPHRHWEI